MCITITTGTWSPWYELSAYRHWACLSGFEMSSILCFNYFVYSLIIEINVVQQKQKKEEIQQLIKLPSLRYSLNS